MKIKKVTHYVSEDGFAFTFQPVEDTVTITKTENGYEARYLVQDDNAMSPDEDGDEGLFLVGYHRDFTVDRGQQQLIRIFKEEDFKKDNGYNGRVYADGYGWKSKEEAQKAGLINKEVRRGNYVPGISKELAQHIANGGKYEDGSINEEAKEYLKRYYIFGLEAYIHSGVRLALSNEGNFCDRQWDVSQLGLVFVSKEEWKTRAKAREAALGLISTWNEYLDGNVYGIVKEEYDANKTPMTQDSCWGFYGYDYALEALKTDI